MDQSLCHNIYIELMRSRAQAREYKALLDSLSSLC